MQSWIKVSEVCIRLEDITHAASTGENTLATIPANTLLLGIGYRCVAVFANDSGEPLFPTILFGSTDDPDRFGVLTFAQLNSTNCYGEIPLYYEDTAGVDLVYDLGFGTNEGTSATGTLELWLRYRPRSNDEHPLAAVRAR